MVQYVPKHYYFDQESEKSLQKKAEEAIAQQEEQGHAGGMAGSRKSVSGASSMFPRPFWKSSQDLNQEKVGVCCQGGKTGQRKGVLVCFVLLLVHFRHRASKAPSSIFKWEIERVRYVEYRKTKNGVERRGGRVEGFALMM